MLLWLTGVILLLVIPVRTVVIGHLSILLLLLEVLLLWVTILLLLGHWRGRVVPELGLGRGRPGPGRGLLAELRVEVVWHLLMLLLLL